MIARGAATGEYRGVHRKTLIWGLVALVAGGATWVGLAKWGPGALRGDAAGVAALAAVLVFLGQYLRLMPPDDRHARSRATLSRRSKWGLAALLGGSTLVALGFAVVQGLEGYTVLEPARVVGPNPPTSGFWIASGRPQLEALYRLGGADSERYLVPLEGYEGQLLVVTDTYPPATPVQVSGRLRTDVRSVQVDAQGGVSGPFLQLYRDHMRLLEDTPVVFLDTGVRAGLNLRAVLLVGVPAYLFLLVLGAPTRREGPPMRVGQPADRLTRGGRGRRR